MRTLEMDMDKLLEIVDLDYDRIKLAKQRQRAVFRHEKPDRWPILIVDRLTPIQEKELPNDLPDHQVYTFENRLCRGLRQICSMVNSRSDLVPSVYPDFGTYRWTECLGMKSNLTESGYWAPDPMPREKIRDLNVDDIKLSGRAKDSVDFIKYVRECLGNEINTGCDSAQSPFGVAKAVMGNDILTEIYDSPDLVHHIMEISLELLKRYVTWMKEAAGVPMHTSGISGLYSENFGLQISEDPAVLLSPQSINEFSMPYSRRLANQFGGASVHYCGRHDGLTKAIWDEPALKGINFGIVPGKVHDQRFEWVMDGCLKSGTVYYGEWPRRNDETFKNYLRRLYHWASQGCLIPEIHPCQSCVDETILKDNPRLIGDLWEELHV
ncbi:MAG: uroporphyrinogen decarboxylase family protein [Victivallales bacterium]